mgnify:CR=1 FL=1
MAKTAGSLWVSGSTIRYVDSTGVEWYATGSNNGLATGATIGSIWVQGTSLRYVDASGYARTLNAASIAARTGSVAGSLWVSNTSGTSAATGNVQLRYIGTNNNEYAVHDDATSSSHSDSHSDGHNDTYSDNPYYTDTNPPPQEITVRAAACPVSINVRSIALNAGSPSCARQRHCAICSGRWSTITRMGRTVVPAKAVHQSRFAWTPRCRPALPTSPSIGRT